MGEPSYLCRVLFARAPVLGLRDAPPLLRFPVRPWWPRRCAHPPRGTAEEVCPARLGHHSIDRQADAAHGRVCRGPGRHSHYCRETQLGRPALAATTTVCSLRTMTPTPLTLTTAIQMLLLMAATSFEHRGSSCLLTLTRSISPPVDQFPQRVCSCPLCIINRLCFFVSVVHGQEYKLYTMLNNSSIQNTNVLSPNWRTRRSSSPIRL